MLKFAFENFHEMLILLNYISICNAQVCIIFLGLIVVTITDLDKGWLIGDTESVSYSPSINSSKVMFGSISLVTPNGYEWSMCKNVKADNVKITCTSIVPENDNLLQGPVMAKGYWSDCRDGVVLGPVFCEAQGSDLSESFRIYNLSIPKSNITTTQMMPSTSHTPTRSINISPTITPTTSRISQDMNDNSQSMISALGMLIGILLLFISLGLLGFYLAIRAKNQASKEKRLYDLLNFDIDTSGDKPFPKHFPKAESPFPHRPIYYHQNELNYFSQPLHDNGDNHANYNAHWNQ